MTVMVAEGAAARGGGRSRARQRRPTDAEMGRGGTPRGSRARTGSQRPRGPSAEPVASKTRRAQADAAAGKIPPPTGEYRRGREPKSRRREAARRVTGAATTPGPALHNYQAIIAVEFVGAALLAALSPFSSNPPQPTASNPKSLSPYGPGDIIKIFAIGIVYMILEFMAAGPRGLARFSAWFGALIFLAVGLSELSNIARIFQVISGGAVNPVKLTGAQAPAVKGSATIPPLGQGPPAKAPPPAGGVP